MMLPNETQESAIAALALALKVKDVGRDQLVDLRKPRWTLKQPCPVCGQGPLCQRERDTRSCCV